MILIITVKLSQFNQKVKVPPEPRASPKFTELFLVPLPTFSKSFNEISPEIFKFINFQANKSRLSNDLLPWRGKICVHDGERSLDFWFCLKTADTDMYSWFRTACHHCSRLSHALRTCIAVRYCMLGKQNNWGIGLTPGKATSDPDRSYFSWCQARRGHVALLSFLEPSINTTQLLGGQIQLWNIRDVLISKCWVLQSCPQMHRLTRIHSLVFSPGMTEENSSAVANFCFSD